MLLQECRNTCQSISELVKVNLTQNQFDALTSLAYNIGIGAFADSTLLKKLNSGDYQGAADQFIAWNKGVINGVKQPIEGLTNRRKAETSLFVNAGPGGTVIPDQKPSPQQAARWLEIYSDQGKTVVVAWKDAEVIEILSIDSKSKKVLIDVINQYPNASNVLIAASGKAIPAGARTTILERKQTTATPITTPPPAPPAQTLARGSQGEQVETMQQRLKELGYYSGALDGDFGTSTDSAVRKFQSDVFGSGEADGKVGPITWAALWETSTQGQTELNSDPGVAGKTYLRLTKTTVKDQYGLVVLLLDYIKDGKVSGTLKVCSGGPAHQVFRTGPNSYSGTYEPLPEGKWEIQSIAWCDGKDNYSGRIFESGLGPVSTPIEYTDPGSTDRGNIEIHIDWNKNGGSPGTAGCIGISTIEDYKVLVGWLRDTDPKNLYVDWGLGTCPKP